MHQKGFPFQIQGSKTIKTIKNVQIDPQTTEIWPNKIQIPLKTREDAMKQSEMASLSNSRWQSI